MRFSLKKNAKAFFSFPEKYERRTIYNMSTQLEIKHT